MARLIFEGYAIIGGEIVTEYKSKQNELLNLSLFSEPSCFFCGTLIIKDNKIQENPRLFVLDWGNTYEIRALPLPPVPPPLAVVQKSYNYKGKEYLLTLYKDTSLKLLLESDTQHYPYAPTVEISSPQITVTEIQNTLLFTVTASCVKGKYILILKAAPQLEKIFEEYGDNITVDNTKITITKTVDDMLNRTYDTIYNYESDSIVAISRMFSYTNEHIYITELYPYLLLEGIQAKDIEYAKSLLTDDLAQKAEFLVDYFGEIAEIEYPKYSNLSLNCVAATYANGKVRIFKFEMQKKLISNIKEL